MTGPRRRASPRRSSVSIIYRIDEALSTLADTRSGTAAYLALLPDPLDADAIGSLRQIAVDLAAADYRRRADGHVEHVEFTDGAFDVLFDCAQERTLLMHGISKTTAPGTRDQTYHRGFPARPGYDKGHAMAHAHGGREGGPNYFPQSPQVNRRLSPVGALWRDIEDYLAAHPGVFSFVRLIYPEGSSTDVPSEIEYGIATDGQFRTVIFPNG